MATRLPQAVVQLLEGCVDAAVVLDADCRLLSFNRAYELLTGVRAPQLERRIAGGVRCAELFRLDICDDACPVRRALASKRTVRLDEIGAVRSDGEELTLIVAAIPLEGDLVIEMYRDVTAEARVQRRLQVLLDKERRSKRDLEVEVAARTSQLRQAEAQLIHQEKMSSLGRLIAGIAHELNNPINFVFGNVDYLRKYVEDLLGLVQLVDGSDQLSGRLRAELVARKEEIDYDYLVEDSRRLLDAIKDGAQRAASIISELREYCRQSKRDLRETDLVASIDTTLSLIKHLIKNRIVIERHYPASVPRIWSDPGRINQVFMNILTNAAQAISGEGIIRIHIESVDEPAAVRVAIEDSGVGMTPEIQSKMMEPFFTTKDEGQGTGLGLWITDQIIRAAGGTLSCSSQVGRGTTFTVTLPLRSPEPTEGSSPV